MNYGWHNWVIDAAERTPDAPAMIGPTETLSFKQLAWRARKYAAALASAGVMRGDIAVIRMPREYDAIATLALSMLGAASASNTAKQYYDFEPITDWLITRQPVENYPIEKQILITPIWIQRAFNNVAPFEPVGLADPSDLIRLIFTSGTTGTPKAVPLSYEQMLHRYQLSAKHHPQVGASLTLFDMDTGGGVARAMSEWRDLKPYLHMGEKRDARDVVALSQRVRIERLHGSPAQIRGFLETFQRTPFDFSALREVNVAGASVPPSLQSWVREQFGITLKVRYGSTECGNIAWRDGNPELPQEYVGEVVGDVEIQIVDDQHQPLPQGEQGVVRYRREHMATEYFRNPEASAKAFKDGWFYPGDLGWLKGQSLYIGGRATEVLNIGGVKIDPALLDDIAVLEGGFQEAAAFGFQDARGHDRLGFAVVAPVQSAKFNKKDAQRTIEKELSKRYRVTGEVHFLYVDELPRGQTGKVLRRELTARAEGVR